MGISLYLLANLLDPLEDGVVGSGGLGNTISLLERDIC